MMKQNDSFAEPRFPVRSYGKGELAMYYLPGIAQQTAVNRLNEWIRTAPGLEQRLLAPTLSICSRNASFSRLAYTTTSRTSSKRAKTAHILITVFQHIPCLFIQFTHIYANTNIPPICHKSKTKETITSLILSQPPPTSPNLPSSLPHVLSLYQQNGAAAIAAETPPFPLRNETLTIKHQPSCQQH